MNISFVFGDDFNHDATISVDNWRVLDVCWKTSTHPKARHVLLYRSPTTPEYARLVSLRRYDFLSLSNTRYMFCLFVFHALVIPPRKPHVFPLDYDTV